MEKFSWITWIFDGGSIGIVVWIIYAILKGKLRPQSYVDEIRRDRDERIEQYKQEMDKWVEAFQTSQAAAGQFQEGIREVTEASRTVKQLIEALKGSAAQQGGGGNVS
jgi:methyl-accepting chemotaxis protein